MQGFTGNSSDRWRQRFGFAVVCVAQFVVVLDVTIVTTALPTLGAALGFAPVHLPWVVTAYALAFGGVLVTGGRLADLLGPRRAFSLGLAVFVAASAGCASAWSPAVLVSARAIQGLGAALLAPAALALLTMITDQGPARRRAVGWWTAAAAGGGASGWVLGGLLTEYLGWRSVFWVNLPIGLIALAMVSRTLPVGRNGLRRRLDPVGALAVTAVLGLLTYALTSIGEQGPSQATSWGPLLLAGGVSVLLVWHLRRSADPLLPPRLFRSRVVVGANLTALALTATTTPAIYMATLYVQQVLRLSPARASLLFPVVNLAVIAGSLVGPAALWRLGPRRTVLAGFAVVGAGTVLLVSLPDHGTPVGQLLAAFALIGTGLGGASVASTHAGTEAAEPAYQGVASGVLTSAAQIGTAFGVAILAPLATAGSAVADGYRAAFIGAGVVALAGLFTGLLLPAHVSTPSADGRTNQPGCWPGSAERCEPDASDDVNGRPCPLQPRNGPPP